MMAGRFSQPNLLTIKNAYGMLAAYDFTQVPCLRLSKESNDVYFA